MKIELLHTDICQGYQQAAVELGQALVEMGMEPRYETVLIRDAHDASQYNFRGSPTIRIDGKDIEPEGASSETLGVAVCRMYVFGGKTYDYPPKELILAALRKFV